MNSAKFFEDNLARITSSSDPQAWNLNQGLLALSREIAQLRADQERTKSETARSIQLVQYALQDLQSRSR